MHTVCLFALYIIDHTYWVLEDNTLVCHIIDAIIKGTHHEHTSTEQSCPGPGKILYHGIMPKEYWYPALGCTLE